MAFGRNSVTSLALVGLFAAAPAAAQTPIYRVTELSTVGAGAACVATALNDAGTAAGSCTDPATASVTAASWQDGVRQDLGKLRAGHYAVATAVNSSGAVIADGDAGDWQPRPLLARNGALLNIDDTGGANMRTVGIMDNGVIFANFAKGLSGSTSSWTPVYYLEEARKPGRFRRYELPRVPGGDSNVNGAFATASNKRGQVVGWVQHSLFGQRGAFWNNDAQHSVVVLEPIAGSTQAIAWGVNDLGQAVGGSWIPFLGDRAVMWDNDATHTAIDLGVLPGDVSSTALAANTAGQVVGVSVSATNERHGFVWQQGQILDLAALIAPEDGAWTIQQVFTINNSGQILALGRIDGRAASILLTPAAQ